jgi:hypothetical protein
MSANEEMLRTAKLTESQQEEVRKCPYEIKDLNKFIEHLKCLKQSEKVRYVTTSNGDKLDLQKSKASMKYTVPGGLSEEELDSIYRKKTVYDKLFARGNNLLRSATGGYRTAHVGSVKKGDLLLADKRAMILEYFGKMYTIDEVLTVIKKDWGLSGINKFMLITLYNDNKSEIDKLQERHRNKYDHIRLTIKTSRLEELTWMYNKIKRKYEGNTNREDHKTMLQTLESIRKEVEGDKLTIQANVDISVQQEVSIQIKNELLKDLPLREIIIGRLAAKTGIPPRELINDLSTSYYAKLNSLLGKVEDVDFEEIEFPSLQSYDFTEIEKINRKNEELDKQNVDKLKIENEKREIENRNKSLKEAMLRKVEETTRSVKAQRDDLKRMLGN